MPFATHKVWAQALSSANKKGIVHHLTMLSLALNVMFSVGHRYLEFLQINVKRWYTNEPLFFLPWTN